MSLSLWGFSVYYYSLQQSLVQAVTAQCCLSQFNILRWVLIIHKRERTLLVELRSARFLARIAHTNTRTHTQEFGGVKLLARKRISTGHAKKLMLVSCYKHFSRPSGWSVHLNKLGQSIHLAGIIRCRFGEQTSTCIHFIFMCLCALFKWYIV